jgi:hypothetical protein
VSEVQFGHKLASIFHDFVKNPISTIKKLLWEERADISHVPAIQWGQQNEAKAINAFQAEHGEVKKVGLFVSRAVPFLGASPDGLWKGCVIEVK